MVTVLSPFTIIKFEGRDSKLGWEWSEDRPLDIISAMWSSDLLEAEAAGQVILDNELQYLLKITKKYQNNPRKWKALESVISRIYPHYIYE